MSNQRFGFPALAEKVIAQMGRFFDKTSQKCGPRNLIHHNVVPTGVLEIEMSYRPITLFQGLTGTPTTNLVSLGPGGWRGWAPLVNRYNGLVPFSFQSCLYIN